MEFDSRLSGVVLDSNLAILATELPPEADFVSEVSGLPVAGPALPCPSADEALVERITRRLQRRVRNLRVAINDAETTVTADAGSWHDRQLIEQAVMKEVAGSLRIEVRVLPEL